MSASNVKLSPLPRLLVSVRDPAEAEDARLAGADLIDAKDPERGALGALEPGRVREIVARVAGEAVTSAGWIFAGWAISWKYVRCRGMSLR